MRFKKINLYELTGHPTTVSRGRSICEGGRITRYAEKHDDVYDLTEISARVRGSEQSYEVEMSITDADEACSYVCTCPAFCNYPGACKHIIAVLIYARTYNSAPNVSGEGSILHARRHSDAQITALIQSMAEKSAAIAAFGGEPVRLEPLLDVTSGVPSVCFSVGSSRMYVIKDVDAFVQQMRARASHTYGKQLTLVHVPESFAPESLPLLNFILDNYDESCRTPGYHAGERYLCLTPRALDEFFELYQGQELGTASGARVLLTTGEPELPLAIRRQDAHGFMLTASESWEASCEGQRHFYVLSGGKLIRCSERFCNQVKPFIDAVSQRRLLYIAQEDMNGFCKYILPVLKNYCALEADFEELELFSPIPLEAKVYLDAPVPCKLTARLVFSYEQTADGDKTFIAGISAPVESPQPYRDWTGEQACKKELMRYFDRYDEQEQVFYTENEDNIYNFACDGVHELMAIMKVFTTEALKAVSVMQPPRFAVGVRLESNLLDIDVDPLEMDRDMLAEALKAYRQKKKYYRLKNGQFLQLQDNSVEALAQLAGGLGASDKSAVTHMKAPAYRALFANDLLKGSGKLSASRDDAFRALVRSVQSAADGEYEIPSNLVQVLRKYQITGYRWLRTMTTCHFGGILADDMGLGKTIQMIACISSFKEEGLLDKPALITCPTSLVFNWKAEFSRFAPQLECVELSGGAAIRIKTLEQCTSVDVIITSYDQLKRDIDMYTGREFSFHVLDEAQYIKNHNTQNARLVKRINSRQRFALTGTPIENSVAELWSIMDFLMPGYLFTYGDFRQRFETPIIKQGDEGVLEQLKSMVAPFMLRRLKKDVLRELPDKIENVRLCRMEDEQRRLYDANLLQIADSIRHNDYRAQNKIIVLAMLTRLRQICAHPALVYDDFKGSSAKLETCIELVTTAIAGGHKVLVFSQFTSMLAILDKRLDDCGVSHFLLQGSTGSAERSVLANRFNSEDDVKVFLISLKAGGTGLNLTGADIVIHYDPWWNFSAQNQAADRAHRIGQSKCVQVISLIAENTIEENIRTLQQKKRELADSLIQANENVVGSMDNKAVLALLGVEDGIEIKNSNTEGSSL